MNYKKLAFILVTLIVVTGLMAACGDTNPSPTIGITQAGQNPGKAGESPDQNTGGSSGRVTTSPTSASEQLLANPQSRKFNYANLEFKVTRGAISIQPPVSPGLPSTAWLKLDLSITNPTTDFIRVSAGLYQIKLVDGTVLKQLVDLSVQARDTKTDELAFQVSPTTTWKGATLQLDEDNKEAVQIALDGPVTPSAYPIPLRAGTEIKVEKTKVTYNLNKASLELDSQGERVEKDKVFLILGFTVSNNDTKYDAYVGDENFRVAMEGKPQAPAKIDPVAEGVKAQSKQDFVVTFSIPRLTKNLTLQVGESDKGTANLQLDLSASSGSATTDARQTAQPSTTTAPKTRAISTTKPATPSKTSAEGNTTSSSIDPCSLFTKQDFTTVFVKAPTEPDRNESPEWFSCDYQFAELAQTSDTVYDLELKVLRGDYTRQKFESEFQALRPGLQQMDGLGDLAYLLPAKGADEATAIFVLKGKTAFILALNEPTTIKSSQSQVELKAAALRVVARL